MVDDKEHDVPCVFQIWVKKGRKELLKNLRPKTFQIYKKE